MRNRRARPSLAATRRSRSGVIDDVCPSCAVVRSFRVRFALQVAESDVGRRGRQAHEHPAQGELPVRPTPGRPGESSVQETAASGHHFGSQDLRAHTDQDKTGRHHHVSHTY